MSRVFFLGSGASAAAGAPLIGNFMPAAAAHALERSRARGRPITENRLYAFLNLAFGLGEAQFRAMALREGAPEAKVAGSAPADPDFMFVLGALDVAISEGTSFGQSIVRKASRGGPTKGYDLSGNELARVRQELLSSVVAAFGREPATSSLYADFVAALQPTDRLITTNWDTLLDFAIQSLNRKVDYGARPMTYVDAAEKPDNANAPVLPLHKLHGSLNWLFCPRCSLVYANRGQNTAPIRGAWPYYVRCHVCAPSKDSSLQAELEAVLVSPTLLKTYRIAQLKQVWIDAQSALALADEWVFVGYSLPIDDMWVVAMLLRAAATQRSFKRRPKITVVDRSGEPVRSRYARLLGWPVLDGGSDFAEYVERMSPRCGTKAKGRR